MTIESFGTSDIGLVRLTNEDVWAHMGPERFYILADGMGGHQAGEVAASETVIKLCDFIHDLPPKQLSSDQLISLIERAICDTNYWVYQLSKEDPEMAGMGTTLCLALIHHETLIYAHVGDSRIYRIRKGRMTRLTTDHSLRGEMIATGEMSESQAWNFPFKNVITRAIGTHPNVIPEVHATEILPGDLYFLCSDGLTDCLNDQEILAIIQKSSSLKKATEALILAAKKKGAPDNITIVMFKMP